MKSISLARVCDLPFTLSQVIKKHWRRRPSDMLLNLFNVEAKNFIPSPNVSAQIQPKTSWPDALRISKLTSTMISFAFNI